jgi:hypothetical protein
MAGQGASEYESEKLCFSVFLVSILLVRSQRTDRDLILIWSAEGDIPGAIFNRSPGNARDTPWNVRPS